MKKIFMSSLALGMLLNVTTNLRADDAIDKEYRLNLMEIAKYHIYAIDLILARKVDFMEHLESHADNLRNISQMFPHLPAKELEHAKLDANRYQKMIEDSDAKANEFVKATRMFRKYRYEEESEQKYKEMQQVFRELQKSCWRCHNELAK